MPVEDTVPNVPAFVTDKDPTWRFPEPVALVKVIPVEETAVKEIEVPVALVKVNACRDETPFTINVLETVVDAERVIVDEVTASRLALLLSRTINAPVEEVAIRTIKFGSTAVSVKSNKISFELVAVIVLPKS